MPEKGFHIDSISLCVSMCVQACKCVCACMCVCMCVILVTKFSEGMNTGFQLGGIYIYTVYSLLLAVPTCIHFPHVGSLSQSCHCFALLYTLLWWLLV